MGVADALETTLIQADGPNMKSEVEAMKAKCGAHATLPSLIDGTFVLSESSAIVMYVADARGYDAPFLVREPRGRALVHQWDRIGDINTGANVLSPWLRNTVFLGQGVRDEAALDKARENFGKLEARLAATLETQAFLASDAFTFADVGPAHILTQLARVDGPKATNPSVVRWLETCTARPHYVRLASRSS